MPRQSLTEVYRLCDQMVFFSVVLLFVLSVWRIAAKAVSHFYWNLVLYDRATSPKNSLTFGGDPVMDTDSRSLFHFPRHCGIADFRRFISISHTHHRPVMSLAKWLTPTSYWIHNIWKRSAGVHAWIWINPEIRIGILNHLGALQSFAFSKLSLVWIHHHHHHLYLFR